MNVGNKQRAAEGRLQRIEFEYEHDRAALTAVQDELQPLRTELRKAEQRRADFQLGGRHQGHQQLAQEVERTEQLRAGICFGSAIGMKFVAFRIGSSTPQSSRPSAARTVRQNEFGFRDRAVNFAA